MTPADQRVTELVDKWLKSLELHIAYTNLTDEAYWQVQPWVRHQRPARWILDLAHTRAKEVRRQLAVRVASGDASFSETLELMAFLANLVGVQSIERFIPLAEPERENREVLANTHSTLQPLNSTSTQTRALIEPTREMRMPPAPPVAVEAPVAARAPTPPPAPAAAPAPMPAAARAPAPVAPVAAPAPAPPRAPPVTVPTLTVPVLVIPPPAVAPAAAAPAPSAPMPAPAVARFSPPPSPTGAPRRFTPALPRSPDPPARAAEPAHAPEPAPRQSEPAPRQSELSARRSEPPVRQAEPARSAPAPAARAAEPPARAAEVELIEIESLIPPAPRPSFASPAAVAAPVESPAAALPAAPPAAATPPPRATTRREGKGSGKAPKPAPPPPGSIDGQVVADAVRLVKWGRAWHELAEAIARIADRPGVVEVRKILRTHKAEIERASAE